MLEADPGFTSRSSKGHALSKFPGQGYQGGAPPLQTTGQHGQTAWPPEAPEPQLESHLYNRNEFYLGGTPLWLSLGKGGAQRLRKVRREILLPLQFFFGGWFFFWLSSVCEYLWLKPRRQKTRSSPFRAHPRFKKKRREKSFLCLLLYLSEPHVTSWTLQSFPMQFFILEGGLVGVSDRVFSQRNHYACILESVAPRSPPTWRTKSKQAQTRPTWTQAFRHQDPPQ